jgi:hypothetical protein
MNESQKWLPGEHNANQPDGSKNLGRHIYMKTLGGWHLSSPTKNLGKQHFQVLNRPAGSQILIGTGIDLFFLRSRIEGGVPE